MHYTKGSDTSIVMGLLILMLALLLFTQLSIKPRLWLYPVVRQLTMIKLDYDTRDMGEYRTEHFLIKYTAVDSDQVAMVAKAAEAAYYPVTDILGYTIGKRAIIYIYPDHQEMKRTFGWAGDESTMGAYYSGVIQVLSPQKWLKNGERADAFVHSGPITHEFTHLVLDYQTSGNYSRWFTEGLAQYVEYKVNHYEWITSTNRLTGNLYTLAELDEHFADLPNQALAYRESFAAVRFIADQFGEIKLRQIDDLLAQGKPLKEIIPIVLGLTYADYEENWKTWARDYLEDH